MHRDRSLVPVTVAARHRARAAALAVVHRAGVTQAAACAGRAVTTGLAEATGHFRAVSDEADLNTDRGRVRGRADVVVHRVGEGVRRRHDAGVRRVGDRAVCVHDRGALAGRIDDLNRARVERAVRVVVVVEHVDGDRCVLLGDDLVITSSRDQVDVTADAHVQGRRVGGRTAGVVDDVGHGVRIVEQVVIRDVRDRAVSVDGRSALVGGVQDLDCRRIEVPVRVPVVGRDVYGDRRLGVRVGVFGDRRRDLVLGAVLPSPITNREVRAARLAAGVREAELVFTRRGRAVEFGYFDEEGLIVIGHPIRVHIAALREATRSGE